MLISRPEEVLYHNARERWYNASTHEEIVSAERNLIRATRRLERPHLYNILSDNECQELSEYYQSLRFRRD